MMMIIGNTLFGSHTDTGKAQYVVQQGTIFEIHRVRREPGSWFAGDAVIEG